MDKKSMRYEIAKEMYPKAIDNAMMVLRSGGRAVVADEFKTLTFRTMPEYAAYLAVSYADALIEELEKGGKESEDERIRKNCIHFLELQKTHHAATFEIEECIAWLEKQGL